MRTKKQGVGEAPLLTHAADFAREKQFATLTLNFWAKNQVADFYQRNGFQVERYRAKARFYEPLFIFLSKVARKILKNLKIASFFFVRYSYKKKKAFYLRKLSYESNGPQQKLHEQLAKEEQRAAHKETIFARRETKSVRRPQKEEEYSAENDFAQQRENDQTSQKRSSGNHSSKNNPSAAESVNWQKTSQKSFGKQKDFGNNGQSVNKKPAKQEQKVKSKRS